MLSLIEMKEKMPQIMACVALIAAFGASVMLLFLPIYSVTTTDPATGLQTTGSNTLLAVNGPGVLIPLAIPLVLTGLCLAAVLYAKRGRLLFIWIAAFLMAVFVLITDFSIGMFYVPAMILSMTSAIVAQFRGDAKD